MDNWMKENRLRLGLKQVDVAEELGVSKSTYAHWEKVGRAPVDAWGRLAAVLKVDSPPERPADTRRRGAKHRTISPLERTRTAAGLSRGDVAAAIGVHPQTVAAWELEGARPGRAYIDRLCDLFKCPPEELGFPRITSGLSIEERNALVLEYMGLVNYVLRVNADYFMFCRLSVEDLKQEMLVALIEALNRCDMARENPRNFAIKWMEREARRAARKEALHGMTGYPQGELVPDIMSFDTLIEKQSDPWMNNEK